LQPGSVVVNTALEHNSNELPWRFLEGVGQVRLPADHEGFINPAHLETVLRAYNHDHQYGARRIRLVSICGASNVMGTCNDLKTIVQLAHAYGAYVLVDAAQLAPHRCIRMAEQGIDLLAFSAHKMYAPFGSGGLIARKGLVALAPSRQRLAVNSGEENVAGLAALGKAILLLERIGMDTLARHEKAVTRYALARLSEIPGLRIYGLSDPSDTRLEHKAGVICFELDGVPHNLLARLLAERGGIGTRSGCFCVNMFVKSLLGIGRLKNTLARTGLALFPRATGRLLTGLVRVSFGLGNHRDEIDHLVAVLGQLAQESRRPSDRLFAGLHFGTPFLPKSPTTQAIEQLVQHKTKQIFALS
jgi:selenocysteine lyase/cysteine desulfurase